ncbi:MAG: lysophospholipase [Bacteroidetes bacterium]|nr:lysophospholipase [Bacteroidota bacterium]
MRSTVLLLHGAFEHAGRYAHVIAYLEAAGYRVIAPNLRGHGPLGPRTVHIHEVAEYVADVKAALQAAEVSQPDFIVAHSMGGLVTLAGLLQDAWQPQRVVLLSPFLDTARPVPGWVLAIATGLDKLAGGLSLPTGVQGRYLTHDEEMQQKHKSDPLIRKRLSVRWYRAIRRAQAEVMARAHTLTVPIALLSAGDDRVVSLSRQRAFAQRLAPGVLLQHQIIPDAYHELLNETQRTAILEKLVSLLSPEEPA